MNYLLDTHTFLWFASGSGILPEKVLEKISDAEVICYLSIASLWEIAIKMEIGKLSMSMGFDEISDFCFRNKFQILQIEIQHLLELQKLTRFHSDPFDRLIIAQAASDDLVVMTRDNNFSKYPVQLMWN
jgi:PIN domain nuclease of toxin-antitoxin system